MSELYMDNIDRALAREHARCHDGFALGEDLPGAALPTVQTTTEEIIVVQSPSNDMDDRQRTMTLVY
jgi:hypothetical protein